MGIDKGCYSLLMVCPLGFLWNFYWMFMKFLWNPYGHSYGSPAGFLWVSYRVSLICFLDFYAISMGFLVDSYRSSCGFL